MDITKPEYWENQYINNRTVWDIGYISPPLKEYFDQINDKNIKILIPGCGNAYEADYLIHNGFKNVFLLDWSEKPLITSNCECLTSLNKILLTRTFSDMINNTI